MIKLQGIIFDFDGTLFDSAGDLKRALNKVLTAHGRRELTLEEVKAVTGNGLMAMLKDSIAVTAEPTSGLIHPSDIVDEFTEFYRSLVPDPAQLYPHVIDILGEYKAKGIKLGLCTNKQEATTLGLLKALDIQQYFDYVAGGDTFAFRKPHPLHVQGVIDGLGVDAFAVIMVGDSVNDVLAAHTAKIHCVVVTHGYGDNYEDLSADRLIPDMAALSQVILELGYYFP